MDTIAAEAGAAKATIYAHFRNKDDLFAAVVNHVYEFFCAEAAAAAQTDASLEERLRGVLEAKFQYFYELVHSSPHANEILQAQQNAQKRVDIAAIKRAERTFARIVATLLEEACTKGEIDLERVNISPAIAAQLLIRSAYGARIDVRSAAGHRRHLAELTHFFLSALAP